jgi:hypothetical protein
MATSYPGALDDFTNPTSGDTLDSPSHSGQHANANDAIEAVEDKLGIGASPAGSAVSGYVLLAQGGGTSTWSSVADTNAVVLTAGGSTVLSTDADIEPLILQGGTPDIATVGSVSANGTTITYTASNAFTAGQAVRITGVNPAQFNFETAVLATAGTGDFTVTNAGTGTYVSGGTAILYQGNLQEWKDYEGNVVASVNQFGKSSFGGLVHINTQTVSAVSAISFNNVFSSSYDNYRIIIKGLPSADTGALSIRFRLAGTDDSTANSYVYQRAVFGSTSGTFARVTDSKGDFASFVDNLVNSAILDVFNPFLASATGYLAQNLSGTDNASLRLYSGTHNENVSYDGFTITGTNTLSVKISVYGYKD